VAIARRIAGVGWVTVSDRRSIGAEGVAWAMAAEDIKRDGLGNRIGPIGRQWDEWVNETAFPNVTLFVV
jgi:hypothetical protein